MPVKQRPESYLDAVGLTEQGADAAPSVDLSPVYGFLGSAGILAGEANRRAIEGRSQRRGRPRRHDLRPGCAAYYKQMAVREAYKNPRRARAFQRVYGWIR